MITRSELAGNPAKAFDKAYGALSGLAIGNSLGDAARKPENRADHGVTIDFNKGAPWSTDDIEFALLAVKTFTGCGGNLTSDIMVKVWLEDMAIQNEFKRGGVGEIEAANNLYKGIRPSFSGKYNVLHMGDGSTMRIGPVGIICAGDPERVAAMTETGTSTSHYRDGIWEAQVVAVAISMVMVDATMEEILDTIMKVVPEESWFHHAINRAFEVVNNANGPILGAWMPLHDELYTSSWATMAEALPSAFACLRMRSETLREGVVLVANFARDADTIGAAAGTILGAKCGASSTPAHWVEKARYFTGACLQFTSGLGIKGMVGELAKLID